MITSTDYSSNSFAALGNYLAQEMISFGLQDNSNEQNNLQTRFVVPTKFGIDFYSGFRIERTIEVNGTVTQVGNVTQTGNFTIANWQYIYSSGSHLNLKMLLTT